MLSFRFEKTGDFGILTFDGELTGERVNRLKEALMISLDNAEHVIVNFENVTKIDSICIRLLCIAIKKSIRLKKQLTLTGIHPKTCDQVEGGSDSHPAGNFPVPMEHHMLMNNNVV